MLEEIGLAYEPHLVSFETNDQLSPEFLSLNPNNKIPAILDPDGPGGRPLALFESGAILIYLAEKTGRLLRRRPGRALRDAAVADVPDGRRRARCSASSASSTSSPARTTRTSARATATWPSRAACSACSTSTSKGATGSWATSTASPTSPPGPGSTTWSASTARATWSASRTSPTCSVCWPPFVARPAVQRGLAIPARTKKA